MNSLLRTWRGYYFAKGLNVVLVLDFIGPMDTQIFQWATLAWSYEGLQRLSNVSQIYNSVGWVINLANEGFPKLFYAQA